MQFERFSRFSIGLAVSKRLYYIMVISFQIFAKCKQIYIQFLESTVNASDAWAHKQQYTKGNMMLSLAINNLFLLIIRNINHPNGC